MKEAPDDSEASRELLLGERGLNPSRVSAFLAASRSAIISSTSADGSHGPSIPTPWNFLVPRDNLLDRLDHVPQELAHSEDMAQEGSDSR
jgi:hypothetical protein